jgi:DNA-binding response OmpR family regulator
MTANCRIAIIEDEVDVQQTIVAMLSLPEFEVSAFLLPSLALSHIAEEKPDIVISDLLMKEIDGIEVIREIRKVSSSTRIIAISGAPPSYLSWAQKLGADAVICKPFRRQMLMDAIDTIRT